MAYDDSRFRGEPGFREEPDFRLSGVPEDASALSGGTGGSAYTPGAYPVADYGAPQPESTLGLSGRRTPSQAQLDDVFDDPEHGEPGRDRMAVHALWEVILLLGVGALAFLLRDTEPAALRGGQLRDLLTFAAEIGLVTAGMGLSLRAAAPNLALGPLVYASALFFADNAGRGLLPTAGVTGLIALGVGVALVVLVVGFHVPGWAASLGVALAIVVWIERHHVPINVVKGAYNPTTQGMYWFGGFVAIVLIGGLLGLAKPVRRAVGRFRPVSDPARRRGAGAATVTSLAIVGSCLLAAVAGVLIALHTRRVDPAENGLTLTGLALGAALLGGTSAFGRRGGVLGTVLSVTLIALLMRYATAQKWDLSLLGVAAATILAGLIVTRLVETFGRPRSATDEEPEPDWNPQTNSSVVTPTADNAWSSTRTGGWTSQLPARATDEGWGTEERWGAR